MAYGEDWAGVGPGYKPPASSAGRPQQFQDPSINPFGPAFGNAIKFDQMPEVGLEDWLNRLYLPPGLKALLRTQLPRLLRMSQLKYADKASQPGYQFQPGYNPFQDYLAQLSPWDLLRDLQGETSTARFPGPGSTRTATRQTVF